MTKTCTYCGEKPIYAKGLCRNCYSRNKRNGTPESLESRGLRHIESDIKINVWKENGKDFTKAARILGCTRQAVYCAVKLYYKPTNADRIRSMTDEELATWIYMNRWNDIESLLEWLRQESE